MRRDQIDAVQKSFRKVAPNAEAVARLFYGKLFALDPSLRRLFPGDLEEQGRKLMSAISLAVSSLGRIGPLLPAIEKLGRRHGEYGVEDRHYDTVAIALVATLEEALGDDFTPAARDGWIACYTMIAGAMKSAARQAA